MCCLHLLATFGGAKEPGLATEAGQSLQNKDIFCTSSEELRILLGFVAELQLQLGPSLPQGEHFPCPAWCRVPQDWGATGGSQ